MNLERLLCATLESMSFNRYMFSRIGRGERFRLTLCFGVSRICAKSSIITPAQQGNWETKPSLYVMVQLSCRVFQISLS